MDTQESFQVRIDSQPLFDYERCLCTLAAVILTLLPWAILVYLVR